MLALKIANLDIDKKIISKLFSISDVTITKTYKKILEYEYIITDNKMTEKILEMSLNQFYKIKSDHKNIFIKYENQYNFLMETIYNFNQFIMNMKYNDYSFNLLLTL